MGAVLRQFQWWNNFPIFEVLKSVLNCIILIMTLRSKLTCLEEIGIISLQSFYLLSLLSLFLPFFLLRKVLQNRLALGFQVWLWKGCTGFEDSQKLRQEIVSKEREDTQLMLGFQCVDVSNIILFWYNTAMYRRLLLLVNTNNTNSVSYIRITRKIHIDRCTQQQQSCNQWHVPIVIVWQYVYIIIIAQ